MSNYESLPTSVVDTKTGQTLTWGMSLDEYLPIKELGTRPVYYGPNPPSVSEALNESSNRRILFYRSEGIESIHKKMSKNEWTSKQLLLFRWERIAEHMRKMEDICASEWDKKYKLYRIAFLEIMDEISSLGCYECEIKMNKSCNCYDCEGCGYKYCNGCNAYYDREELY